MTIQCKVIHDICPYYNFNLSINHFMQLLQICGYLKSDLFIMVLLNLKLHTHKCSNLLFLCCYLPPLNKIFSQLYTARQCSPLRRKFMECSIINPALSLLMKHLFIDQCEKAPNFSAFHWSPHGGLVSIGQHLVTMRVVYLQKRTETSLITESDQRGPNHQIGPGYAGRA